ncbi:MAG: helix-turn-helix transcriptional regulator [Haliea sp.]|nr:helix-turn-helix transcriptional regulator [Haliea sp.]
MARSAEQLMTIEGELHGSVASAQLVHFNFPAPIENLMQDNSAYRVDLCLTPRPRNARACYPQRWGAQRFERIGDVFMVPPGEAMLAVSDGRCKQTSIVCKINPPAMQDWFDGDLQWTERSLSAGLDIRERNIHTLLLRLADETRHPGFASEMLVELIAAQIAIELARYCTSSNAAAVERGLSPWRLRKIDERLQEISAPPTLSELAQLCQISVRQLTRGFRLNRGCSIGDYVAENRLAQARQLLATDQSIKSIAYALGFASPSSFCFAFRRATAETPSQFRQRLVQFH